MRSLSSAVLARLVTLPVSVLTGLAMVSILVRSVGPEDYGLVNLIIATQILYVFLDLGTGAAVLNGAATWSHSGRLSDLTGPLRKAILVTVSSCSLIFAGSVILSALGWWPTILGREGDSRLAWAMTIVLGLNVASRTLSVVATVLLGMGRQVQFVLLQVLIPLTSLCWIVAGSALNLGIAFFGCAWVVGQLVFGVVAAMAVLKNVSGLSIGSLTGPKRKPSLASDSIWATAVPMSILTAAAAVGTGFDRLMLSHLSSPAALASYAIAAQVMQPLSSLVQAGHQAFWGEVARRRASSDPAVAGMVSRTTAWLIVLGGIGCGAAIVGLRPLTSVIAAGQIEVPWMLAVAFGVAFWAQVAFVGPGGALTTARGLATQARLMSAATVVNLGVSLWLAPRVGAAGPVIGTGVGGIVLLIGGWACWVRMRVPTETTARGG